MKEKIKNIWESPDVKYLFPFILFLLSYGVIIYINHGSALERIESSLSWLIKYGTPIVLFSLGAGIVLSTGGVDVSFVGVSALTGVVTAIVFNLTSSVFFSIICGVSVGFLSGMFVGYLIAKRNSPSLIVSWATGMVWFSLSVILSKSISLPNDMSSVNGISVINFPKFINHPFLIAIFLFLLIELLNYSGLTRKTKAIGANRDSAIYAGVNVSKIEFRAYILNAVLASIAGIIWMSTLDKGLTEPFLGQEIVGIAIAVLGGTVMSGGYLNLYSIVASAYFYVNLKKIAVSVNSGLADEQLWLQILLAIVFIFITLLFGKKINGSTTPIQIDRNTKD